MKSTEQEHQLMVGSVAFNSQREHIGPGWWGALHAFAYVHDTSYISTAREMFIEIVKRGIGEHFPCLDCRAHALTFMNETDPIDNILKLPKTASSAEDAAATAPPLMICLAWSYRFHDAVNQRLKKIASQRPTFSQVEKFLSDLREGKGCNNCGPPVAVSDVVTKRVIRRQTLD